jgi:hypothetical protein
MKKVLAILVLLVVIFACKKKEVDGTVIITVYKDGKTVQAPSIYLKKGAISNPSIALSSYDQNVTGNKTGQYTFENLPSDDYFFYATIMVDSILLKGSAVTSVEKKLAPNRYELKISVN